MRLYTAVYRRFGNRWAISVPELPGVHPRVTRLDQAEALTRRVIAGVLGIPADSFDLRLGPARETSCGGPGADNCDP